MTNIKCALLNGVMVALQILVLSVWVRVLVEQQRRDLSGLFFVVSIYGRDPTSPPPLRPFFFSAGCYPASIPRGAHPGAAVSASLAFSCSVYPSAYMPSPAPAEQPPG